MESQVVETPDFKQMSIAKLREYAAHLRLAVPKTSTKEDIIEQLINKLQGKVMPELATSATGVKPGYAKIVINEDSQFGAENIPVYINANGYVCTIPRGVPVIVPHRVVRTLNDAIAARRRQSKAEPGQPFKESTVNVLSYPFQILEMVPGPEVLTKLEQSKLRSYGPRERYAKMFGHWPKPRELRRAVEKGLISISNEETVPDSPDVGDGDDN